MTKGRTNIAVIEPSGRLYGSEYSLLDIIDGLPGTRFKWRVILPQGSGFDQLLLDRGIECEFLIPRELGALPGWKRAGVYVRILWRLRQIEPDLLYVNQAGSMRFAAVCARILKVNIVCQVQTLEDAQWLSGHPELHDVVLAFVCNSQFIAAKFACDERKKNVLYYGITEERMTRAKHNHLAKGQHDLSKELNRPVIIGILGRIAVSKGHYLLLEAARLLKDQKTSFRYVVIGEGLTSNDTKQFSLALQRAGLEADFELRGYRTDLALELSRLDLLVIPSLAEPLGRVLFDGAEQGVPVVLADAGGLGELGRRFKVGIRFKSGDAEALAKAIVDSIDNYSSVSQHFQVAAESMFVSLSIHSYMRTMESILRAAADHRTSNQVWLGDG